nr:iron uptake transporter permease EfeU [Sciscionella marina]
MWADAVPNLLIGLRDGLEAGLVISLLLAAVRRVGQEQTERVRPATAPIWVGVIAAAMLALSFGAVLTFYSSVLSTSTQDVISGVLSIVAVGLVTWMIFWMRQTAASPSGEIRARITSAVGISAAALALTAFLSVGREGLEMALFLWTAAQALGETVAPAIGTLIGLVAAVVLCVLLYRSAIRIRLGVFFNRTAVLLVIIAAGVFAYGLRDLQDAGVLPGHTWIAFDLSAHVDPSSWWVSIITGVTALSPTMTWLQAVAYVVYLGTVLVLLARAKQLPTRRGEPQASTRRERTTHWSRVTVLIAVISALVLPPAAAASVILIGEHETIGAQRIEVTANSCAAGFRQAHSGGQTYTVDNKSGHTAEVNLVQSANEGIVAEIETLGPATQQSLPVQLSNGDYQWRCLLSGRPTTVSPVAHITGGAAAGPPPVKLLDIRELDPAVAQYRSYVAGQLAILDQQVAQLRNDLDAGDLLRARTDWLPAQLTWERVGGGIRQFRRHRRRDRRPATRTAWWSQRSGVHRATPHRIRPLARPTSPGTAATRGETDRRCAASARYTHTSHGRSYGSAARSGDSF